MDRKYIEENLIIPTVNLNGTRRDRLIEQRCDAAQALDEAVVKMGLAAPHPRDFPGHIEPFIREVFHEDRYRTARAIHDERVKAICKIINDIREESEQIVAAASIDLDDRSKS
jgi:hypothetical protein